MKKCFESIKHNRRILACMVTVLALMVAVGTTYTLISPANTMETPVEDQVVFDAENETAADENADMEPATEAVEEEIVLSENMLNENGLTAEEQSSVDRVIKLIEDLPTYEQIEEKILAYEEENNMEAMEAYYNDTILDIKIAQNAYTMLDEKLQDKVTNYEKLQDLEGFAQMEVMLTEISSAAPTVTTKDVKSTNEFVKLNMFDYYGTKSASAVGKTNINSLWNSNKKYPGFQWNGGAYMTEYAFKKYRVDNIDFGNSVITDFAYGSQGSSVNDGYSANRQMVGNQGGTINKVIGYTNQSIGYSSGDDYDALNHKLVNGYPALSDGTSLKYLFSESSYAKKLNTSNIDGLFQQNSETGEYWYDSRDNHAYYNNNKFTLYDQIITPNFILYPFGNFLPLNGITNLKENTQVSAIKRVVQGGNGYAGYMQTIINRLLEGSEDSTEQQLIDMLARYRDSLSNNTSDADNRYNWTVVEALNYYFDNSSEFGDENVDFESAEMQSLLSKLYNIDFDVEKNFMFGMNMEMNFMQPKNGLAGNDTNQDGISDYPMKFYFAGDDDVWVFIDDILFLDLTGIHRHVGGDIDFVNGKVNYYMMKSYVDGQVQSTPYKTYTFEQILTDIGGVPASELGNYLKKDASGNYTTFKDYSNHKFNFYYMERGTGSSVCRINFNFPMLRQNTISVGKEVTTDSTTLGDPYFSFQILKADSKGNKTGELFINAGTQYKIYNDSDELIGTGTVGENGIFKIKAGQHAEFEGIKENAGKYYVRELFEAGFKEQYDSVTVSGESTTVSGAITIGTEKFEGADSPVKDCSDGATKFRFVNNINEKKLGGLQISKTVVGYDAQSTDDNFDFEVLLDGEKLPADTAYTVTDGKTTKTVTVASDKPGIITLAHGETAVIKNIKAGTNFQVTEVGEGAELYSVTYKLNGTELGATAPQGVITPTAEGVDVSAAVHVTNDESGTNTSIPVNKTVKSGNNGTKTFLFNICEVNANGNVLKNGYTAEQQLEMSGDSGELEFPLTYRASKQKEDSKTYYYKITEVSGDNDAFVYDQTEYIVEVTVVKENKALSIGSVAKYRLESGEKKAVDTIHFENEQLHSLEISKTVTGRDNDETQFDFTVTLANVDKTTFNYEKFDGADLVASGTIEFDEGAKEIQLKSGEKFVIKGLPAGAVWTVKEHVTLSDGYVAKVAVNGGESEKKSEASSTITNTGNSAEFVNEVCYTLPETGSIGTKPFYIGGLVLIAAAGIILMRQRRREV